MKFKFWMKLSQPPEFTEDFGLEALGVTLEQWQRLTQLEQKRLIDVQRFTIFRRLREDGNYHDWRAFGVTEDT